MKKRLWQRAFLATIFGLMWISSAAEVFSVESFFTANYDRHYTFTFQHERYWSYWSVRTLYLSIPPSLYDYYKNRNQSIYHRSDYAKFVTPVTVKPIAESIKNITRNLPYKDEQFANAVLTLIRQIPYGLSGAKYPVETLVDNFGDCGALSIFAASIMKAGGLDVVLILYTDINPRHMSVGVHLPYKPVYSTWWMPSTGFEYGNKTYWTAEVTSGLNWKVGDQHEALANVETVIIPLDHCETSAPAQVASSLSSPLLPSSISINLSPKHSRENESQNALTVSGSISLARAGESVVMYVRQDDSSFNTFRTVTDDFGNYSFTWNLISTGTYYVRTSWNGASNYAGADSEMLTVFVGPRSFVQFRSLSVGYILSYLSRANTTAYKLRDSKNVTEFFKGLLVHELRNLQGVKEFLNANLAGTSILLTGEFIVLRGEQTSFPRSEQTTITRSAQTITVTSSIDTPVYLQPTLPDDFNRTINNMFGIMLQRLCDNNYRATVRGLDYYDVQQIVNIGDGNGVTFLNATSVIRDNAWYSIVARMATDEVTVELFDADKRLLETEIIVEDMANIREFGIIIIDNTDAIVVFKNLDIKIVDQPTSLMQPTAESQTSNGFELPCFYVGLSTLLATAVALIVYIKGRKNVQKK